MTEKEKVFDSDAWIAAEDAYQEALAMSIELMQRRGGAVDPDFFAYCLLRRALDQMVGGKSSDAGFLMTVIGMAFMMLAQKSSRMFAAYVALDLGLPFKWFRPLFLVVLLFLLVNGVLYTVDVYVPYLVSIWNRSN